MDARSFLTQFGDDESESVAKRAGTTLAYFKQLAYRARRPSYGLAKRLVSSDDRLDLLSLLDPPDPTAQQTASAAQSSDHQGTRTS